MCILRQDLRQVAVALVGDDDRGAGLGDQEVGAGDADVGGEEVLAQDARAPRRQQAGRLRQVARRRRGACGRGGNRPPPGPALTCTAGAMMWLGDLAAQLDDVFAEIGLDRRDAVRLEMRVEADLLGDHRLALGDGLRAAGRGRCRGRCRAPRGASRAKCTCPPAAGTARLVALEIEVEMGERVVLDVARGVAQLLEFRQPVRRRLRAGR